MKVYNAIEDMPEEFKGAVVTIGNFDGVHSGHRFIFSRLLDDARARGRKAVVITFEPHPKMLLHPERRPFYLITTLEEKLRLIGESGIDAVLCIPFSLKFAETTAEEFVNGILWDRLRISKILIGHDYTFGKGKQGNESCLKLTGKKLGFEVEAINAFMAKDKIISSSLIRNHIIRGEVRQAAAFLGRPYNLKGVVVEGEKRGASLGFPTANVMPDKVLIPEEGVYAVLVELDGKIYKGALNIGHNPTFGGANLSVEVFIIDLNCDLNCDPQVSRRRTGENNLPYQGNLYGKSVELFFIDCIRKEIKFDSPEKLIAQIRQDVEKVRLLC